MIIQPRNCQLNTLYIVTGVIPTLNLQSLPKLSSSDPIGKYIDDTEAFASIPSNVADLEMEYKQIDEVMTDTSSKEDAFSIQTSGIRMN